MCITGERKRRQGRSSTREEAKATQSKKDAAGPETGHMCDETGRKACVRGKVGSRGSKGGPEGRPATVSGLVPEGPPPRARMTFLLNSPAHETGGLRGELTGCRFARPAEPWQKCPRRRWRV